MGAPSKPGKFKCVKCVYTCSSKPTLDNHVKIVHEGMVSFKAIHGKRNIATFQCEECKSTFHTNSKLNRHKKTEHLGEKKEEVGGMSPPHSPDHKKVKEDKIHSIETGEDEERLDKELTEGLKRLREEKEHTTIEKVEEKSEKKGEPNPEKDEEVFQFLMEINRKNKLISVMNQEFRDREASLCKTIREQDHAKIILTNHLDAVKEELSKREESQIEWEDYARKYKRRCNDLKRQIESAGINIQNSVSTIEEPDNREGENRQDDEMEEEVLTLEEDGEVNPDEAESEEADAEETNVMMEEEGHNSNFKCDKCQYEDENEQDLARHKATHIEILHTCICEVCGQGFARETALKRHSEEEHEQFNCDKCSFQTTTQNLVDKHKVLSGHLKVIQPNKENEFKCKNCPNTFSVFKDLMVHRKASHRVPECNKPNCNFGESCWYMHPEGRTAEVIETSEPIITERVAENQKFKCRVCDNDFNNKSALMKHRKIDHIDRVRQCTDFTASFCRRGDQQCWYRHSMAQVGNSQNVQPEANFRPAQVSQKPPDQQEMMRSMMLSMQQVLNNTMNEMMAKWMNQ